MPKITLPNLSKVAMFGIVAVVAGGLTLRYSSGVPLLDDARKGFNGDSTAWFG